MGNCTSTEEAKPKQQLPLIQDAELAAKTSTPPTTINEPVASYSSSIKSPATNATKEPSSQQAMGEDCGIEVAERIFRGVQCVSKAELYTWKAHEAVMSNEEGITNAAAKLANLPAWQDSNVGNFISGLLSAAAKHTPAPFSAVVSAVAGIVKIVVAIAANKFLAKQLADRLISLHPAIFILIRNRYPDAENLASRLLSCIAKCQEVLEAFADLGDEAGFVDKLKQKWSQFTTSPDDFNECHNVLDRVLGDITFATAQQELVGPRKRPSAEELQQMFRNEAASIVSQLSQHVDLKLDEKDQKDETRSQEVLFSVADLTRRVNILLEKAGEQDVDALGTFSMFAQQYQHGEIPSHLVTRVPHKAALGSGGRAIVYEGLLKGVIPVALKSYFRTANSSDNSNNNNNNNDILTAATQARAEYDILRNLQSVSGDVVRVYGIRVGTHELVMEKLDRSLEDFIVGKSAVDLSLEQKLSITMCLIRALRSLHGCSPNHIIHGDLKLSNLMVTESRFAVKLIDFGSASSRTTMAVSSSHQQNINEQEDSAEMTLAYAAPELIEKGVRNEGTDIFAFAVTCFELWEGRRAHHDRTDIKTLVLKQGKRPEFDEAAATTPAIIRRMIEWSWAQDPGLRPDAFKLNEIRKLWAGDLCRTSSSKFFALRSTLWPQWMQSAAPLHQDQHPSGVDSDSNENSSAADSFPSWMDQLDSQLVSPKVKKTLAEQQINTFELFANLTDDDLKEMFKEVGARKVLKAEIERLSSGGTGGSSPSTMSPTTTKYQKLDLQAIATALSSPSSHTSALDLLKNFNLSSRQSIDNFLKQHEVFRTTNSGKTLLHLAVLANFPKFCEALLDCGDNDGASVNRGGVRQLIAEFDDAGYTPLMYCAVKGSTECAQVLILRATTTDQLVLKSRERQHNAAYTALHHAAYNGHPQILRMLVRVGGASPEVRTAAGFTPLITAVFAGKVECVKMLIEQLGADVNAVTDRGSTPVFVAAERDNADMLQLLIDQYNANASHVTAPEQGGFCLLHQACYHGRVNAVSCLISKFPKLFAEMKEAKSASGSTPLLHAVDQGHIKVVELLLAAGANAKAKNFRGKDALALARTDEMKKLLK